MSKKKYRSSSQDGNIIMSKKKYRCVSLELTRKVEEEYPDVWEKMVLRGGFEAARKISRICCIENYEEYPDHQRKDKPVVNE